MHNHRIMANNRPTARKSTARRASPTPDELILNFPPWINERGPDGGYRFPIPGRQMARKSTGFPEPPRIFVPNNDDSDDGYGDDVEVNNDNDTDDDDDVPPREGVPISKRSKVVPQARPGPERQSPPQPTSPRHTRSRSRAGAEAEAGPSSQNSVTPTSSPTTSESTSRVKEEKDIDKTKGKRDK